MKTWTLSEAKNKFSQVVEMALREGPQQVSVATKEPVVVISRRELDRLAPGGVKQFFDTAPDLDDLADLVAQLKKDEISS
jgi:prevent-host-death family protein